MRLTPQTFWAMSVPEWRAAVSGRMPKKQPALSRAEFDELMKTHG